MTYSWGDADLDELIGPISRGVMMLIMGHPGAGKTSLVSKFIYHNMKENGAKALYVGLSETRSKYFQFTESLGLNLRPYEEKGLFKYFEIPVISGEEGREIISGAIMDAVKDFDPDIIVIDSITPILWNFDGEAHRRAFLHSGIYKLVSELSKVVVLIADLPYGRESADLGGAEFVADIVLVLKVKSERGKPTRWIEVRKIRGRKIVLSEVPFVITEGRVIRVVRPPIRWDLRVASEALKKPVDYSLIDIFGPAYRGSQILVLYDAGTEVNMVVTLYIVRKAIEKKRKVLLITNSLAPEVLRSTLTSLLAASGFMDGDPIKIQEVLDTYVDISSQDFLSKTTIDIIGGASGIVEEKKPDIAIVFDVKVQHELLKKDLDLFNSMQYLFTLIDRAHGIVTVRLMGITGSEDYSLLAELSDKVIYVKREIKDSEVRYRLEVLKVLFGLPTKDIVKEIERELNKFFSVKADEFLRGFKKVIERRQLGWESIRT